MRLVDRALAPWMSSQQSHKKAKESMWNLSSQRLKTGVETDEICRISILKNWADDVFSLFFSLSTTSMKPKQQLIHPSNRFVLLKPDLVYCFVQ